MLGIIGAMDEEVAKLKEQMTDVTVMKKADMEFCEGKLGGCPAVVVRSGIGKVNAAMCAQILGGCVSGGCHYQHRDCRFSERAD